MRLEIRFKDDKHQHHDRFEDATVDRIDLNPPNSMLVHQGGGNGSIVVLLLSDMAKVTVT